VRGYCPNRCLGEISIQRICYPLIPTAVWKKFAELYVAEPLLGAFGKINSDALGLLLSPAQGDLSTYKWHRTPERLRVISTFQDLVPSSTDKATSLHLGNICCLFFFKRFFFYFPPFSSLLPSLFPSQPVFLLNFFPFFFFLAL